MKFAKKLLLCVLTVVLILTASTDFAWAAKKAKKKTAPKQATKKEQSAQPKKASVPSLHALVGKVFVLPISASLYSKRETYTTAEEVEKAIQAGADINARNNSGETPVLQLISHMGLMGRNYSEHMPEALKIFDILIKAGADVNLQSKVGDSPLMIAAKHLGDPSIIKTLLSAGADPNLQDSYGNTALMEAVSNKNTPEVVKALLDGGADIKIKDNHGGTAWRRASGNISPEILEMLLDAGADVNEADSGGGTVLVYIVKDTTPETVKMLLDAGAMADVESAWGYTAVQRSLDNRSFSLPILKMLVEAGGNVNRQVKGGMTALMGAVMMDKVEEIKYLLAHGADVNARDKSGKTALWFAKNFSMSKGDGTITKILESAGGVE